MKAIGRLEFFGYMIPANVLAFIVQAFGASAGAAWFAFGLFMIPVSLGRLKDLDLDRKWAALEVIPGVNIILNLWLLLQPGLLAKNKKK